MTDDLISMADFILPKIRDEFIGYLRYLEDQKRDHELAATG